MGKFNRYDDGEDYFFNFTPGCDPSRGPEHCCEHERSRRYCRSYVSVFAPRVDDFIKDYQKGSDRICHVKYITFYDEEMDEDRLDHDPLVVGGSLEENVNEEVLAPEFQEKIFSALYSVWNLISEWELEEPIALEIKGRYFRSNDKRLTDLAHQKNLWRLACEDAPFADPLDVLKMAKLAPNLGRLGIHVRHMNKQQRTELASDMRTWKTTLPELYALTLHGEKDEESYYSRGDGRKLEDMREDGIDMLCREMRLLTQKRDFYALELMFVPISAELWQDTQNPQAKMSWPTLKRMKMYVHEMSSTGTWLFSKDPKSTPRQYLEDPDAVFFKRTVPVEGEIRPLAELFERAWEKMPCLEEAFMVYDKDVKGPVKFRLPNGMNDTSIATDAFLERMR